MSPMPSTVEPPNRGSPCRSPIPRANLLRAFKSPDDAGLALGSRGTPLWPGYRQMLTAADEFVGGVEAAAVEAAGGGYVDLGAAGLLDRGEEGFEAFESAVARGRSLLSGGCRAVGPGGAAPSRRWGRWGPVRFLRRRGGARRRGFASAASGGQGRW